MSQILARVGISVQHPCVHPTTGRKGSIYSYMQNIQFHANPHTREQALTPPPPGPPPTHTFLFSGRISLIEKLVSKIN